ncbi:MAG: hypothetical protein HY730_08780 [Candidatus Tectomicrobia bacterium]|uniref:DUF1640 domain-containing protein n=1 Tax=Tectimicrobiota bacterium TaxID=2528274 RepID=A0A933GN84_UNCTE|nr:hypothetical protein [Candidatus Tectomicrobia bacterium]
MPVTLPIDVYEVFEKSFGKENAHMVVKSLEATISDVTDYRWKVTKDELLESIRKEFVTREIFEERFKNLEIQMDLRFKNLENKMDERFHSVDERFKSLNFKLNIFLAIAFIALTFANPTFVKLLERLLKF